jgi:hypothetical protein
MELVSRELVEKLTHQKLVTMCQLLGVVYRQCTASDLVERLWRELARREGDLPDRTILAHVPKSVWETVRTSKGEKKAELVARQRALAKEYGEEDLQPLRGSAPSASQAVEIYVTPQRPTKIGGQEARKTRDTRPLSPPALDSDQGSETGHSERRSEAGRSRHSDDEDWATAGPRKHGKTRKSVAKKREEAAGPSRPGAGASAGAGAKRGQGMGEIPKTQNRPGGSGPAQALPAALKALGPQFGRVCKTLRAVSEELRRSPSPSAEGHREHRLSLADRAEDALGVLEAFLAGMETEKIRGALATAEASRGLPHSNAKPGPLGAIPRPAAGRRWSDVVAQAGAIPAPRPPRFEWDARRTIFLKPLDPEAAKRPVDPHHFGACFAQNFQGIPGVTDDLPFSAVERVDRTPTNGWKVQLMEKATPYIPTQEFLVPGIEGRWLAERMRAPTSHSVVVYGIDQRASDEAVAAALVRGSAKLLEEKDRPKLQALRVRRLLARAPSGGGGTGRAEAQEGADSRITRACRVYLPADLAQFFVSRGEMMFDYVGRRVKEYVPTQFYCKHCKSMGSHSTQYHRAPRAAGHADRPPGHAVRPPAPASGQRHSQGAGPSREGGPQES